MANSQAPSMHAQSRTFAVTVALTAVAFWRPGLDVFASPKFAVMVLGVAVAAAFGMHRAATMGTLEVPVGLPVWIVAGFSAAVVVATVASDTPALSFFGAYSRHTGGLFYLVCALGALLFLQVAGYSDAWRWTSARVLAVGVLVGMGLVTFYGVVQIAGLDPFEWVVQNERVGELRTSTFGNPNFTAAFLGAGLPVAVWAAWDEAHPTLLRIAGGATAVATVGVLIDNGSVQGPVTAAAGLLILLFAVILDRPTDGIRRLGLTGAALFALVAAGVVGVGLAGVGPLRTLESQANIDLRTYYWGAGWRMFTEHPLTGVGLDRYGAYFGAARSAEAAERLGLTFSVDAAHNVPIQLFATGGILVGAMYVAFLGVTAWGLVGGLIRTSGRPRLLLGALGGVWFAYQAQSLVSIDTPPLALMHWLSAAAILWWSGLVASRTVELPWASSRRKHQQQFRRRLSFGLLGVLLLGVALLVRIPLAASTDAARGMAQMGSQDADDATHHLRAAAERASWEPTYWQLLGQVALDRGDTAQGLQAYLEALERDPRSLVALVTAARIAQHESEVELAQRLYERALVVEPQARELLSEAAEFHAVHGDASLASQLSARAERADG